MRHGRHQGKLGIKSNHRKALLRNLVRNLVIRKRIRTTWRKAKVASAFADSMIELAKREGLHARRVLISNLGDAETANSLIKDIAPRFKDRRGGYTRVLRLGTRPGDNAEMAFLELTAEFAVPEKPKKAKKEKKSAKVETPEAPKPKKEKTKASEAEAKEPKSSSEKKGETAAEKKEAEKKGGFLGALRRFIKGDDKSF